MKRALAVLIVVTACGSPTQLERPKRLPGAQVGRCQILEPGRMPRLIADGAFTLTINNSDGKPVWTGSGLKELTVPDDSGARPIDLVVTAGDPAPNEVSLDYGDGHVFVIPNDCARADDCNPRQCPQAQRQSDDVDLPTGPDDGEIKEPRDERPHPIDAGPGTK